MVAASYNRNDLADRISQFLMKSVNTHLKLPCERMKKCMFKKSVAILTLVVKDIVGNGLKVWKYHKIMCY